MGLVHAWWVAAPALLAITLALTLPAIGVRPRDLLAALAPVAAACGAMAAVVLALRGLVGGWPPFAQLAALAASGAAAYGLSLWLAWPAIVRDAWAMLRRRPDAAPPVPAAPDAALGHSSA